VEFTIVYRDAKRTAYAKRVRILKFIRNKEYRLVKDEKGRVDLLLQEGETGVVKLTFAPQKRQRVKGSTFDLSSLELIGAGARGTRLAAKPVSRISFKPATKAKPPASRAKKKAKPKNDDPGGPGGQTELF